MQPLICACPVHSYSVCHSLQLCRVCCGSSVHAWRWLPSSRAAGSACHCLLAGEWGGPGWRWDVHVCTLSGLLFFHLPLMGYATYAYGICTYVYTVVSIVLIDIRRRVLGVIFLRYESGKGVTWSGLWCCIGGYTVRMSDANIWEGSSRSCWDMYVFKCTYVCRYISRPIAVCAMSTWTPRYLSVSTYIHTYVPTYLHTYVYTHAFTVHAYIISVTDLD